MKRPESVVLVRHAESMRNKAKAGNVFYPTEAASVDIRGVADYKIEITPVGEVQARSTGIGLRQDYGVFDYAYYSGYQRTKQTLDCILEAYTEEERNRTQLRLNPFIRERDTGYCYDMTQEQADSFFPWREECYRTQGPLLARPPGGESIMDVCQRVYTFLGMLFERRVGERVLIVTHGGTIRAFRFWLEKWDYEFAAEHFDTGGVKNCGIVAYTYNKSSHHLELTARNKTYW